MLDTYPHSQQTFTKWPVYVITLFVGLFVLVVTGMWVYGHIFKMEPIDETAWIILGACILRTCTVVIALASIQKWGEKMPYWIILGGLSGAASAQLIYPVAEFIMKLIILAGFMEYSQKGLGNMSATGWFNLFAVWIIFGIPGILFAIAAKIYKKRKAVSGTWLWIGSLLGIIALAGIGFSIG